MTRSKLITVTFTKFFKPYGIKAGTSREVSPKVAKKLYEIYEVIDNPFDNTPKTVTVQATKYIKDLGWPPYSIHLASYKLIKKYIDDGDLAIVGEQYNSSVEHPEYCSDFCHVHYNTESIARWMYSLDYKDDKNRISSISLAVQCDENKAKEIYQKIKDLEN